MRFTPSVAPGWCRGGALVQARRKKAAWVWKSIFRGLIKILGILPGSRAKRRRLRSREAQSLATACRESEDERDRRLRCERRPGTGTEECRTRQRVRSDTGYEFRASLRLPLTPCKS